MSNIVYLTEFAWTFESARADRGTPDDAAPPRARHDARNETRDETPNETWDETCDVIRRFASFNAFLEQLILDLNTGSAAQQRASDLAELEEERLMLARHAGR